MPPPTDSPPPEPVLVTGATGLLGRHVVAALTQAGDAVRVLARAGTSPPPGVTDVVRGDLTDAAAVRTALRSVRVVYHLAAITAKWLPDPRAFDRVNVAAAVGLARQAAFAGVERVVHVSSFTVFGPSAGSVPSGATAVADAALLDNDYQRSKHRAHEQLAAIARNGDAPVVLGCPGVVYGQGPRPLRNPIADLMERQLAGRLRGIPGLDRAWTLAFAPDVAHGLRLLRARGAIGDSYLLGGPVATLRDVCSWVADRSGRPAPRQLPLWPFLALGRAAEMAARLSHARTPPRLSAAALRFLRHSWAFSSAKALALGYRITSLEEGLLALWTDLHARHLVPNAPPAAVPAA